jgi:hypothetical protein
MKVTPAVLSDVLLIETKVFGDRRRFYERFDEKAFNVATGLSRHFVQDNPSRRANGVLQELHYRIQQLLALRYPFPFRRCGRSAVIHVRTATAHRRARPDGEVDSDIRP